MSDDKVRWRNHSRGPYIRTFTGKQFFLKTPSAEQIDPLDVAHNLAGIMRYTGASRYSVAQHCVVAARMAVAEYGDNTLARKMLIHDVAEAYYGDMSSPLKSLNPSYKALEFFADRAVEQRFGETFAGNPLVKEIDDRMWLTESRLLFGEAALEDYDGPLRPFDVLLTPWKPARAEREWLSGLTERFPEITW